ncbi:carbohydrate kinase family protein [Nocardia brasiliensis]|uniref:carbohydrate kinase family protein n=1 Tax=Nocardia brasiliensis TaxID=37326 RepID=UPI003D934BF1
MVCVSYLALAELWTVPRFPVANGGAEIRSIEWSVAADGPMTAAVLASLGVPSLLISNDIGDDQRGHTVQRWLTERHVQRACAIRPEVVTPRIVVVADEKDTRTWFAHLPEVAAGLAAADLSAVAGASFVYLDAYELLEEAAVRVIATARTASVPLLINLGGSPLSTAVQSAVAGYEKLLIQTNVDDDAHTDTPAVAKSLLKQLKAAWAVVTAGAHGAVAVSGVEEVSVPAFPVAVRHTHCAGAAFSGGLLYGLRAGWPMRRSMVTASASGALRCARHHGAPLPSLAELTKITIATDWADHRCGHVAEGAFDARAATENVPRC